MNQAQAVRSKGGIISDIEVLRAFAIIYTILTHRAALLSSLSGQRDISNYFQFYCGVDLFLAISGFVIAKGLMKAWVPSADRLLFGRAIVAFWIRRIWRIWPTSWLWAGIGLFLSALVSSGSWAHFRGDFLWAAATMTGTVNIFQWSHFNDFGNELYSGTEPFGVYWSLSLEEQFYMILPLIMLISTRKVLYGVLVFGILAQFFLARAYPEFLWFVRSDALSFGVLIAVSLQFPAVREILEPTFLAGKAWLSYVCTGLLLLLLAIMAAGNVVPFFTGMIALFSAVLVWFASFDRNYVLPNGLAKRVLVWIGSRSYAIYVIHPLAVLVTKAIWAHLMPAGTIFDGRFTLRFLLTVFVLLGLLAEANYRLVETPLRRRGAAAASRFLAERRGLDHPVPHRMSEG